MGNGAVLDLALSLVADEVTGESGDCESNHDGSKDMRLFGIILPVERQG